ncbi:pyroglutamyl-peptidase I [Maritalea porphyrae]|uniref:Pyrrolidone-carboxylate peptidase n=1 Tax=Maritalea porphyrae TaxID=880732 RepID=A0ABQ5UQQ5_9HYPH|nr:pyroglutamyl-peptidase I [Maritalea porphyrae]GLQ17591.1 pyrrolidone-carboxylate peptidase [Maritalea porphyrae]
MTQRILLTGFEPFGGEATNPSMEIAKALDGYQSEGFIIQAAILPVVRHKSVNRVVELIKKIEPTIVIALGVAVGRSAITPEKVAINFDDFRIPDNAGNQPIGEAIRAEGAAAHFSTLPINLMTQSICTENVPGAVSFSAGTFVCNHVMYGALDHIERNKLPIRAGFIHVPQATEFCSDPNIPTIKLQQMVNAICKAIAAAVNVEADVKINAGNIQ